MMIRAPLHPGTVVEIRAHLDVDGEQLDLWGGCEAVVLEDRGHAVLVQIKASGEVWFTPWRLRWPDAD